MFVCLFFVFLFFFVCLFFFAGIHPSRTYTSGSFQSVRWNARMHRLDLGLYSHPKEFWESGVRTHVNSKGNIPSTGKKKNSRKIEPTTLHHAGQRAQHTANELSSPPPPPPPAPHPHRLGFDSRFRRESFSRSSHASDLKIDTPVATLSGAWS